MNVVEEVLRAEQRIRPHIRETILDRSAVMSAVCRANVYCKLESLQYTGSFKVRGAMNKIMSLSPEARSRGVVAASTGNHGAAVVFSMKKLDTPGIVFVPEAADRSKVRAIERLGGEVRHYGRDPAETEVHARQYAADNDMTYVSPYNDPQVVGGQGTISVELERQLDRVDALFVSVGGGGLISGVAGYLKTVHPRVRVIGCSPENSQVMIQSVKAGRILDLPSKPTLSDGTAGGVEQGAITFELCRTLVDEYVTVSEDEIAEGLRSYIGEHHMLIEGAAAVALASFSKMRDGLAGQNVVIILCGGNVSVETLKAVL